MKIYRTKRYKGSVPFLTGTVWGCCWVWSESGSWPFATKIRNFHRTFGSRRCENCCDWPSTANEGRRIAMDLGPRCSAWESAAWPKEWCRSHVDDATPSSSSSHCNNKNDPCWRQTAPTTGCHSYVSWTSIPNSTSCLPTTPTTKRPDTLNWRNIETYTGTPAGGSQAHSPVVKLAYICSLVRGSTISTHSILKMHNRCSEQNSTSQSYNEVQRK